MIPWKDAVNTFESSHFAISFLTMNITFPFLPKSKSSSRKKACLKRTGFACWFVRMCNKQPLSDSHSPMRCLSLQGLAFLSRGVIDLILERNNTLFSFFFLLLFIYLFNFIFLYENCPELSLKSNGTMVHSGNQWNLWINDPQYPG